MSASPLAHEHRLAADGISVGYGDRVVIDGLDLAVHTGVITTVIGPNGCGKSTLLRALGRLLTPRTGQVTLDGKAIGSMKTRDVARTLGVLPQSREALTQWSCHVETGRHPFCPFAHGLSAYWRSSHGSF